MPTSARGAPLAEQGNFNRRLAKFHVLRVLLASIKMQAGKLRVPVVQRESTKATMPTRTAIVVSLGLISRCLRSRAACTARSANSNPMQAIPNVRLANRRDV
jgi:hypothetical protein